MKMKKILFIVAIISFFDLQCSVSLAQSDSWDDDDYHLQFVSWGLQGGVNASSFIMRVDPLLRDTLIMDSVLSATPAMGVDLGAFFEYRITDHWRVQLSARMGMDRATLRYSDHRSNMLTLGADFALPVLYRTPFSTGSIFFSVAPYCHFVFFSDVTEGINLYRRQIYTDPVTGKDRFALSDIHAGIDLAVGYEFESHWQLQLDARFGITDILNLETPGTFVYPYKVSLLVGYHFEN
jgi:hypothetical protein